MMRCWNRMGICLFMVALFAAPSCAEDLRVMSFNIRYGAAKDGDDHWKKRNWLVADTVRKFNPDLLGTQETLKFQADYLERQLRDYTYFGRSRMKTPNEHCGIFFRTDRFTQLAGGHFWLSESPEIPESKSWDSSLPRMASWVLLNDRLDEAARPILFVNTHFDHRGKVARLESAKLIRQRIDRLRAISDNPLVVVTGDFNTPEGSEPYNAFLEGNADLIDSYRAKHPEKSDEEGTFNGFRGRTGGGRIDWVLASPDFGVLSAEIDRHQEEGRYPSDHFPVTAVLRKPTTGLTWLDRTTIRAGAGIGRETRTLMMMVRPRIIIPEETDEPVLGTTTQGETVQLPNFTTK